MELAHGFKFHWVAVGFGAVIVGKILAAALAKYVGLAM